MYILCFVYTRITKNFEFKKGVGIEIKSKETRSKQKVRKQAGGFIKI